MVPAFSCAATKRALYWCSLLMLQFPCGDDGMDGEDRENRQYLEQGWMLRVVGQIVVEDGQRA